MGARGEAATEGFAAILRGAQPGVIRYRVGWPSSGLVPWLGEQGIAEISSQLATGGVK